jgi:hypothetical protein
LLQLSLVQEASSLSGRLLLGFDCAPALGPEDWAKFHKSVCHLLPAGGDVGSCFLAGGTFVAACASPESLDARDFVRAASFLGGAAGHAAGPRARL